jgi:hypothetical protein
MRRKKNPQGFFDLLNPVRIKQRKFLKNFPWRNTFLKMIAPLAPALLPPGAGALVIPR